MKKLALGPQLSNNRGGSTVSFQLFKPYLVNADWHIHEAWMPRNKKVSIIFGILFLFKCMFASRGADKLLIMFSPKRAIFYGIMLSLVWQSSIFLRPFGVGIDGLLRNRLWRVIIDFLIARPNVVIYAQCENQLLHRTYPDKVILWPNYRPDFGFQRRSLTCKINIVYVGSISEEKGFFRIIDMARRFKDYQFTIVSNGLTEDFKLPDNIKLVNGINEQVVKSELNDAHFFLMLSNWPGEGLSGAVIEALSTGLPIIINDHNCSNSLVGDANGIKISIERDYFRKIEEFIDSCLKDENLYNSLSMGSRKLYLKKYRIERLKLIIDKI